MTSVRGLFRLTLVYTSTSQWKCSVYSFSSRPQGCFIFSLVKYKPLTYNKVYKYPDWAIGIGWTLALASMICIPMVVVIKIIQSDGPLIEVCAAAK